MNDLNLDNSSDVMNFNRKVVNYCNDNEHFFFPEFGNVPEGGIDIASKAPGEYAQAALDHYNAIADGYGHEPLEDEHAEKFKKIAAQAQREGFVPHAGSLSR